MFEEIKTLVMLVKTENPYPSTVFTEPTKDEWKQVQQIFKDAGLIQDRFFGSQSRIVWNTVCDDILKNVEEFEEYKNECNNFDKIKWCGCGDELTHKEDIETGLCWLCRAFEEDRRIEKDVRTNRYYDLIKGRMWMKGNATGKYWSLLCNSRDAKKDARLILGLN